MDCTSWVVLVHHDGLYIMMYSKFHYCEVWSILLLLEFTFQLAGWPPYFASYTSIYCQKSIGCSSISLRPPYFASYTSIYCRNLFNFPSPRRLRRREIYENFAAAPSAPRRIENFGAAPTAPISKARAIAFEVCILQIYSRNLLPDGYKWHRMLPESQSEVCILQI